MKLSQALQRFNNVPVDGWDGSAWVPAVAYGQFVVFDQFITERSFGQKKRLFNIGGATGIPPQYEVVRTPDSTPYLVAAHNPDIEGVEVYNNIYLIQRAADMVQVMGYDTETLASGMEGNKQEVVRATVHCDYERYSSESSSEFNAVRYGIFQFYLPRSTDLSADNFLRMDGVDYEVRETAEMLNTRFVMATRRGTS